MNARSLSDLAVLLCLLAAAPAPPVAAQESSRPAAPAPPATLAPGSAASFPAPEGGESATSGPVSPYWRTKAEKTGYRQSADYDETVRYLRQLEGGSRWIKLGSFGTSGQGRDLPYVVVSHDRAFTPEQARATGKPVVLVLCGIHSGEIEGKDAMLALMRDMAALRTRPELLDSAIVLVVPMLSADAHEQRGPYNRINQNGPEEMGWRTSPIGLNLNRDFLKAESPEIRALLANLFLRWRPHLLVDTHTTDGADYRHDVTYAFPHGAGVPVALDRWLTEAFEGRVVDRLRALGHLPAPYVSFRDWHDPRSGIDFGNAPPRFSNGYPVLHGRAAILVETHMLKPYHVRVRATYDLLAALLEELRLRPRELTAAVAAAEAEAVARGRERDPAKREFVLATRTTDDTVHFAYQGIAARWEWSDVLGASVPRYTGAPWDTILPVYRRTVPTLTVRQPAGYLVPREWEVCRDRLDLHGVRYRTFARAFRDTVEVQRIAGYEPAPDSWEGHRVTRVKQVETVRRLRAFRPGDLWVPLDQPSAPVAVHLFEAQAPDGLTLWNQFDTVLQQKEYAEDYVIEPIARQMLKDDPALAREFQARLKADSAFAASPQARGNFFYRRSKWADPEQDLLPISRALRAPPADVLAPEAAPAGMK